MFGGFTHIRPFNLYYVVATTKCAVNTDLYMIIPPTFYVGGIIDI